MPVTQLAFAALSIALLAPLAASAQSRDDALPFDVVEAILRNVDGPMHARVVPGARVPEEISSRVTLPPGSSVIAVLASSSGTRVIGAVPGEPDSVRLWFAHEFERRGYQPVEMMNDRRPSFRSAEPSPANSGYCAGTAHYEVSAQTVTPGRVEFVLTGQPHGRCEPRRGYSGVGGWSSGRGSAPPDLPLVHHPRSVESTPMCRTADQDGASREHTEPISTTLPAARVLAHYDRQLDSLSLACFVARVI